MIPNLYIIHVWKNILSYPKFTSLGVAARRAGDVIFKDAEGVRLD